MLINKTWRVYSSEMELVKLSDEEYLVFNEPASDSSLLNAVDACMLQCLLNSGIKSIDSLDLLQYVAHELQIEIDDLTRYVAASLEQMAEVGLILSGPPA